MGGLTPVAFDIETSGLDRSAVVTVAGFGHELGYWLFLNTAGRSVETDDVTPALEDCVTAPVSLTVVGDERELLEAVTAFVGGHVDGETHYLTAYNGETWNGGFDLPFLRSACHRNDVPWPFGDIAYADTMEAIDRFDTGDVRDLEGVYDCLVGDDHCDPFEDSGSAVDAFEAGDWLPLLQHNLADIQRTRELAELAGRFVPSSDFQMKNLEPPQG
jgi:hypothetical protein